MIQLRSTISDLVLQIEKIDKISANNNIYVMKLIYML